MVFEVRAEMGGHHPTDWVSSVSLEGRGRRLDSYCKVVAKGGTQLA